MRVINRLRAPGVIKSVRLDEDVVRVITDEEVMVYRRVENESMQGVHVRRSPLPSKLRG